MYASSRVPSAADISATACSKVSDFDGRPACLPLRRVDQRGDVAPHQVIALCLPDRPDQHVVRDLQRPRRQPRRHRRQRPLHIRSGELRQPDGAKLLVQGLHARAPVQGHGPRRQPVHAMSQPVLERVTHGVAPPRPQPALHLLVQVPELVPDLGLGPAGDLLADARPGSAEAQADSPDVPVLGLVPVDRVLTLPAAAARRPEAWVMGATIRRVAPMFGSPATPPSRPNSALSLCARQDSNPRPAA